MNPAGINKEHQEGTAHGNGGEHGNCHAKAQGEGEAFHRSTAQEEEDAGGNDDGHVRIENGDKGPLETGLHRQTKDFARRDFFLESFKNKDVGVHRHPH